MVLLNSTLIPTLTGNSLGKRSKFYIFSDKLNHASMPIMVVCFQDKNVSGMNIDLNHLNFF